MKINRIVGVIPLYQPKKQDFPNILKYINDLDYCFLLDDTGKDNSFLCKEIVDVNPDKIQYVCNTENIGLCASVNNGFKLAKEKNTSIIDELSKDRNNYPQIIDSFICWLEKYSKIIGMKRPEIYQNKIIYLIWTEEKERLQLELKLCGIRICQDVSTI